MDEENFVRELVAAVPEAFETDWEDYYSDDDGWLGYIALGDARCWVERHALSVRRGRTTVRQAGPVRRLFDCVERVAASADDEAATMLWIELAEGNHWLEDVVEYMGPQTRAVLGV